MNFTEQIYLVISPLMIKLEPHVPMEQAGLPSPDCDAALRSYYLKWQHLEETTGDDVKALLSGFWQRFYTFDQQPEALDYLGLDADASWPEIQQTYRRLAASHHPDKGGDKMLFIKIREAYELLKKHRTNSGG